MSYDNIEFYGQDILIILDLVDNTTGRAYVITWRENKTFYLLHLNADYKTWNGNLYGMQLVNMWHEGKQKSTHSRVTFLPKHMHLQSGEEIQGPLISKSINP